MKWREAEVADLFRVDRQWRQGLQDTTDELKDTPATRDTLRENARTWVTDDGTVLAVMGISQQWKGVGHAWGLLSQDALRHPVALTRGAMRWLAWFWRRDGYHRIHADIEVGHKEARRWLVFMGFRFEGRMRRYGPAGLDHDLYALTEDRPWPHQ
jgi:RimJ/RimL family protein N-acetyltransferase